MSISPAASRLHSADWRSLPPDKRVRQFFATLQLTEAATDSGRKTIRRRLRKEHGPNWAEIKDIIARRADGDTSADFYAVKNRSLELSLAVGNLYAGTVHRHYLTWFASQPMNPARILDIGAENGLLACFYALQFPDAEVIAIDPSGPAIACSRELAVILGLDNIRFLRAGLDDLSSAHDFGAFDVITCTTVFQEAGLLPVDEDPGSGEEPFEPPRNGESLREAETLRSMLAPGGTWISLERCRTASAYWGWICMLTKSRVEIDWLRSQRLDCSLPDKPNDLTLLVLGAAVDEPAIPNDMAKAVWLSARFRRGEEVPGEGPWIFRDEAAVALYAVINPKEVKRSARRDVGYNCTEWIELSTAGPFALLYCGSSYGAAFLRWSLIFRLNDLETEFSRIRADWRGSSDDVQDDQCASGAGH